MNTFQYMYLAWLRESLDLLSVFDVDECIACQCVHYDRTAVIVDCYNCRLWLRSG